jgi:uncharacterized protein YndB with AHSA1/START domain
MSEHGTYATDDGRPAVRFERRLPHPVDAVWRCVTEPAELRHWFPTSVELELRVGAPMRFEHGDGEGFEGELRELDPPHRIAFLWGDDLLRFELEPDGDGTRLTLVHVLLGEGDDAAARTAAGWHVCLAALERTLAGAPAAATDGPSPEWRTRYDEYVALGFPAGAPIPGDAQTTS